MAVDYQKLYAFLVGEMDNILQRIADDLISQKCDWHEMNEIGNRLKNALLEAEESVIGEDESPDSAQSKASLV